jgi:aspartate dehydrogenase
MSIGGLADEKFREELFSLAREKKVHIYLPSGAIGGIDLLKASKVAGLNRVILRTTKNSRTLGYEVKKRTLVFKGKASEAIKKFPKSVNVSVLLSIVAGMDIDVEVYADPNIQNNVHEIHIEGGFGEAEIKIKNKPSPQNPKTSYLAVLSPINLIGSMDDVIKIGV